MNGLNILSLAVMGQFMNFTLICYFYTVNYAHKHHVVTNFIILTHLVSMLLTARSKVSDLQDARQKYSKTLRERDNQFYKYMKTY